MTGTREFNALYEIISRLHDLEPEAFAQAAIEALERTMGYEYCALLLVDRSAKRLTPFALSKQGHDAPFLYADKAYVSSRDIDMEVGITGWVAKHGESVIVGDVRSDPRYFSMRNNIHSELCVPLKIGEDVIGVLNTETSKPDAYAEKDKHLLEMVATQIAMVIENNLCQQLQQWLRHPSEESDSLSRVIVICSYCDRIRDTEDTWTKLERFIAEHTQTLFSHGVCPECNRRHIQPQIADIKARQSGKHEK